MQDKPTKAKPKFGGFHRPNYTQVPDELFDMLLPDLSGAELKVLLYIIRRTFGFKRDSDTISLSQMMNGITRRDGTVLDRGVGLSKPTLLQALRSLTDQEIIFTERRHSDDNGNAPTSYQLHTSENAARQGGKETQPPLVKKPYQGVGNKTLPSPRSKNLATQYREPQYTEQQHVVVVSKTVETVQKALNPAHTASSDTTLLDALVAFGIIPKVGADLIQRFPDSHILSKLDIVAYLVESGSPSVAKNPAGYLRRAIEEDWQAPKSYQAKTVRETKKRDIRRVIEQVEEDQQQEEMMALKALEQARKARETQFPGQPITGSDLTTKTAWIAALDRVRARVSSTNFSIFFRDTQLLSADAGEAVIAAPTSFTQDYLQQRLTSTIRAALEEVLAKPYQVRIVVVPFEEPNGTPSETLAPTTRNKRQPPGGGTPVIGAS